MMLYWTSVPQTLDSGEIYLIPKKQMKKLSKTMLRSQPPNTLLTPSGLTQRISKVDDGIDKDRPLIQQLIFVPVRFQIEEDHKKWDAEILKRAAEIRATWTPQVEYQRQHGYFHDDGVSIQIVDTTGFSQGVYQE